MVMLLLLLLLHFMPPLFLVACLNCDLSVCLMSQFGKVMRCNQHKFLPRSLSLSSALISIRWSLSEWWRRESKQ
jgi:hypothetical protein